MNRYLRLACFLSLMLTVHSLFAQHVNENTCYISDNTINFVIDRKWTKEKLKDFQNSFSIDSTLISVALNSKDTVIYADNVPWKVVSISPYKIILSKPLSVTVSHYNPADLLLIDDNASMLNAPQPGLQNRKNQRKGRSIFSLFNYFPSNFGINKKETVQIFEFKNDSALFILKDFREAKRVILSGSFNNWSTMKLPMQATSEGWVIKVPLQPGKHQYKYIVDGWWTTDPINPQAEPDGQGGFNSVIYAYNYSFRLSGFPKAKKVFVTGSFNNWNPKELSMIKAGDSWNLSLYLRPGTHAYKFIVDRQWINDPENAVMRNDGRGNVNSYLGIGDTMVFRLPGYENARAVYLAGSFNAWNHGELIMDKTTTGWELPMALAPGTYEYKYIVDGKWMTDPDNAITSGQGEYTNSVLTFLPNHTFILNGFAEAKNVFVTGSFNEWRTDGYVMQRQNGQWVCPVYLNSGKHTYKFIVDGQWMVDPANETWESNNQGTGNSVLWID